MFRKTFIRLTLIIFLATAGLLVMAAMNRQEPDPADCNGQTSSCLEEKTQGEFFILESISRSALMIMR